MPSVPPLLQVQGLGHAYGPVTALADVSLAVQAGEVVALLGRNGAGKSTLLRCIAAWAPAERGEVSVCGEAVRRNERRIRRRALLVPDTPAFWDELTAWEHLRFVAGAHHLGHEWPERAERLLGLFGLAEARAVFPAALSRGMRHKLALAMALLLAPPLLLLDEPFGPLDPLSATRLWDLLERFAAAGGAVLVSCHQWPPEAAPHRCLVMEAGRLWADAPTSELARRYGLDAVTPDALLRAVVAARGDDPEPADG